MTNSRIRASFLLLSAMASAGAMAERPVQVVSEGKASNLWSPAGPLPEPAYPAVPGAEAGSVCVSIGYYLGEDGIPTQFAHLKSWSDSGQAAGEDKHRLDPFAQAAVATLMQRRFVPVKASRPKPVYTAATFVFAADSRSDKASVRGHCEIRDLKAFVTEAQMQADPLTWEQLRWNREWFQAKNTRVHGLNRE